MQPLRLFIFSLIVCLPFTVFCGQPANPPRISLGIDLLLRGNERPLLKGKRVGILTNHTGVSKDLRPTVDLLKEDAYKHGYTITALFAPEHGHKGTGRAFDHIADAKDPDGIPIYSLHGDHKRPTKEMLNRIDVLVYDIQDIGTRSYTFSNTLFYFMEEAAKERIPVIVLDRPNPINGMMVDGPVLENPWRSFLGYLNVPYCHGMTIGELARYFNSEYQIGADLRVIPMEGWNRHMTFADTGLQWIPTSPQIPEPNTPYYYPTTGILGELQLVNIGVGYTLPFKVVGAPWIKGEDFAKHLNKQNFPGVRFEPFCYKPFFGRFANEECEGVLIFITNLRIFKPVATQYLILGMLKSLYPQQFAKALEASQSRKEMFHKVNGTDKVWEIMMSKPYIAWELKKLHTKERKDFLNRREHYLIPQYNL